MSWRKVQLLFLLVTILKTQILLVPSRPESLPQFGFIPLSSLDFDVATDQSDRQEATGFNTIQNEQSSRLVYLPLDTILFPGHAASTFYEAFGLNQHTLSIQELSKFARSIDGRGNNKVHILWGSAHIPLQRMTGPIYTDGISKPRFPQHSPRHISNKIGKIKTPFDKSIDNITAAFVFWGQFLDHDVGLTQVGSEYMPIEIPRCDPFMDRDCDGSYEIPFNRSHFEQHDRKSVRQQINFVTAWIDGSQVYGSDEQTMNRLRTFQNGRMKVDTKNFLPRLQQNPFNLFDAGDNRINQNIVLTSYHTLFVREHNRIANVLLQMDPFLSDEETFQAARNYVIAILQKITFQEFLPLMLGKKMYNEVIGEYKGYNPRANPNLMNQFSTAAFRIGHSIMTNHFPLLNRYREVEEELSLHEMFFKPDFFEGEQMEKLLRGVTNTKMKERSPELVNQLRNLLIPGPEDRVTNLDLFALNIQRGLDHGIGKYNDLRKAFGLRKVYSFKDMVDDTQKAEILEEIYGSPDNCDSWVGIICEKKIKGAVMGQLGGRIIAEQFRDIRDGDKYWYESDNFPLSVVAQIRTTYFADIIMRNTKLLGLQAQVFLNSNPIY